LETLLTAEDKHRWKHDKGEHNKQPDEAKNHPKVSFKAESELVVRILLVAVAVVVKAKTVHRFYR